MSKVAIVTASDSGIGKAIAIALAKEGFDVGITWNSDEEGAKETAKEVEAAGQKAEIRHLDLTELPEAVNAIDELADALGGLNVLVNNAGFSQPKDLFEVTYEDWRQTLGINLDGAFFCAQRAAKRMVKKGNGGRIINITSVHEHTPLPDSVPYTASKHGMGGMTKALALDLSSHNILVNSIAPGFIATPMNKMEDDEEVEKIDKPGIPISRPGSPEEIANMAVWLSSEKSSYTTGQSFIIDGGFTLVNPQFASKDLDARAKN